MAFYYAALRGGVKAIAEFVDLRHGPVFERVDRHQRVDLQLGNGEFVTSGRAFCAIAVDALDVRAAHPLHALFVCCYVYVDAKTTMF
jgi:chloramphenicol 3-O-phosphotransferase